MATSTKLRPSAWDTWSNCPGAPAAVEEHRAKHGRRPQSTGAKTGTAVHRVAEECLRARYEGNLPSRPNAGEYLGTSLNIAKEGEEPDTVRIDTDMVESAQILIDYVDRRVAEMRVFGPVTVRLEAKFNPEPFIGYEGVTGQADVWIVSDHAQEVIDFKNGYHPVGVGTVENPNGQCMLGLLGLLGEYFPPVVVEPPGRAHELRSDGAEPDWRVTVVQPHSYGRAGPIKSLTVTPEMVYAFSAKVQKAIEAGQAHAPPRIASEVACHYCEAAPACEERAAFAFGALTMPEVTVAPQTGVSFEAVQGLSSTDLTTLTPAQLVSIIEVAPFLRDVLKDAEALGHELLASRQAPPELAAIRKLVRSRERQKWVGASEEGVLKSVQAIRWTDPFTGKSAGLKKAQLMKQVLRTPTQIAKEFKKLEKQGLLRDTHMEALDRLITRPDGGLAMVPIGDERPDAMPATVGAMFPAGDEAPEAPEL